MEPEQVTKIRNEFKDAGVSITEWARGQGFAPALVYSVLNGKNRASRGQSHKIAIRLGLKSEPKTSKVIGLISNPPADVGTSS